MYGKLFKWRRMTQWLNSRKNPPSLSDPFLYSFPSKWKLTFQQVHKLYANYLISLKVSRKPCLQLRRHILLLQVCAGAMTSRSPVTLATRRYTIGLLNSPNGFLIRWSERGLFKSFEKSPFINYSLLWYSKTFWGWCIYFDESLLSLNLYALLALNCATL